jgi:riboflavin synthase
MFTGIVETIGIVKNMTGSGSQRRITIDIGSAAENTKPGDSIAVNGLCLTVTKLTGSTADFDVSHESLRLSTLGELTTRDKVNIERALPANGRFGGHIVQGHIDGTGKVSAVVPKNDFSEITITCDEKIISQMVPKGSIAVDGISLTIAAIENNNFKLVLIPTTLEQTTWQNIKPGRRVNIETDILVKIVIAQLTRANNTKSSNSENNPYLTEEKLRSLGF